MSKNHGYTAGPASASHAGRRELLMAAVDDLSASVGVKRACDELAVPRAGFYRRRRRRLSPPPVGAPRLSARRLEKSEKQTGAGVSS